MPESATSVPPSGRSRIPRGALSEASAAGPRRRTARSAVAHAVPEPASGVIVPVSLTRRTRLFTVSAIRNPLPVASAATVAGPLSCASTAGPWSPHSDVVAAHAVPVPADAGDRPAAVDAADAVAGGVGDQEGAARGHRDVLRQVDRGQVRRTAVARRGGDAVARPPW